MGVFDNIKIDTTFGDWIQVLDNESSWTIEDFPYNTGVNEKLTYPHCEKCVAVNQCCFKNEKGKKPEKFNYSKFPLEKLLQLIPGLYHPFCHCKEHPLTLPSKNNITFIFLEGKINYFFLDKINWYHSWGYKDEDKDEFITLIKERVKESFINGNYEIEKHTKYGVAINVFITIPGKNEKTGKYYNTWSCYTIFPNGKLKLNTIIGGK